MSLPAVNSGMQLYFTCSICGFYIIGHQDALRLFLNLELHGVSCNAATSWLSEFRAFHINEPFLSGVGRNSGPAGIALSGRVPVDPRKHCDGDSYREERDSMNFAIRSRLSPRQEPSDVGYPVHESCWQLLKHQAQIYGIEDLTDSSYTAFLSRLHHSTWDGLGCDYWAGDYGGLIDGASIHPCSFRVRYLCPLKQLAIPAIRDAMFNPIDTSPISVLVEQAQTQNMAPIEEKPIFGRGCVSQRQSSPGAVQPYGPEPLLHTLPTEIIFMIAEHLSTHDLLSFWIASPVVPDYLNQSFWRSRFKYGMEFGHLFELRSLWKSVPVHWYTLFWKVRELSSSAEVGAPIPNRRRILTIADRMVQLTLKCVNKPLEGKEENAPSYQVILETDGFLSYWARLTLPSSHNIKALHISTIQLGNQRYISGLRVNGSASGLGYFHEDSRETFLVDTASHGPVREIRCYMDSMGVRGLFLITDRGFEVGQTYQTDPNDQLSQGALPLGERLIGHFDETRFIALGVDGLLSNPRDKRNTLLWKEALPQEDIVVDTERHLFHKIHEHCDPPWIIRYNPVQYHLFNTRDSLVKITGYMGYIHAGLLGLEFTYRSSDSTRLAPTNRSFFGVADGTPMEFPIDGPGGEYITGVTVTTLEAYIAVPIVSLFTNHNRSIRFCVLKTIDPLEEYMLKPHYGPGPNEYVAGLMWASGGDKLGRIWNFGVVCRPDTDS